MVLSGSIAWASSVSISISSRARSCVAARRTGGAQPDSCASSQRAAHTHQRSPGRRPGKPSSGCGVERSFPALRLKLRNSSVTIEQTVWLPTSSGPVAQQPSRKKPVSGWAEHSNSSPPTTFLSGSLAISLDVRLGRGKDHQELEVLDDVDKAVLGALGHEGDRPGRHRLSLPLDFELGTPREHVVDLVLGVRCLAIDLPRGEAVDARAEHPRTQELPPL